MIANQPTVFIGSSSEALSYAEAAKAALGSVAAVTLWTDGGRYKEVNKFFLDSLVEASNTFDFAVMVFGADDTVTIRKKVQRTTRDNVLFELGLFWSRLGRERTFALAPKFGRNNYRILTDLQGLTLAEYKRASTRTGIEAGIAEACASIAGQIRKLGRRETSSAPRTVSDIARPLEELMKSAKQLRLPVVVKNIALDMEATWPMVRDKVLSDQSEVEKLTWRSLMVDHESRELESLWSGTVSQRTARNSEEHIKEYCAAASQPKLLQRQIDFACRAYSAIPLLHGFLVNDTTAFLSLCGLRDGRLFGAPNPYLRIDKFSAGKLDSTAAHLIEAFESWFDHQWTRGSRAIWPADR